MQDKHVLSVFVVNHPGVLSRVSGLFSRRGFNINSLSVGETEDPEFSRITIVVEGDNYALEQITRQLAKLFDVKRVTQFKPDASVCRELLLIKVKSAPEHRSLIIEAANIFRAKTVDLGADSIIIELTGESSKIDAFIDLMRPYGILEIARTGLTALERGSKSIKNHNIDG
ncbi:MAG: acetolactate synthase small subunit [Bacillota bacterium]|nr:acetolactate synthase small subunit [Bacillota bacterium]